jgi:ribonuclease J
VSSALEPDAIRLVPLGGLGEIGMNCLAIEQQDGIFIVDCGTAFPHDDHGVELLHPDFTWLFDRAEKIHGIFLTHGHEDHIGALPFLLAEIDAPVWGPPHALGLVRRKLAEYDFELDELDLLRADAGRTYEVGPFVVEPVRVAHSIVEATALRIATRAGTILHTGDFNLDPNPPDGEPTDERRLSVLGAGGVDLMLSDSTNIDTAERPGSERGVVAALERIIADAPHRVFIGMFASNMQRLMMLPEIARNTGRKICILGRSLSTQVEVGSEIGRLHFPSDLRISPEEAASFPRQGLIVLAGGSQAESGSALRRLAAGTHPTLSIDPDDTVVLSSRIIPGNERPVFEMMNDLLRRGVRLHTRATDPDVHTSGHAGRSEQARMLELVRPRAFLPVHGTLSHLRSHAELARSLGVSDVLVVENGVAIVFDGTGLREEGPVPHGKVPVAIGGEPLRGETLQRRVDLGRRGVALVSLIIDGRDRLVGPPEVTTRGVPRVDDDSYALRAVARDVVETYERVHHYRGIDLVDELRRAARRRLQDLSGTKPVVEIHLLRDRG